MRAEVLAIGTELLLGQVVDTNSSWIGGELAASGIDCLMQVKVGDNIDRIVTAMRAALERSDVLICCGGLGPTQDDLTREALARVAGESLVFEEERAAHIEGVFRGRGRRMPLNNLRQAERPESATFLTTQPGTAPGLRLVVNVNGDEKLVFAVPGVPWEMQEMLRHEVLVELRQRAGIATIIQSRTLRTWGESESGLAEQLQPRIDALDAAGNPTIAFLASGIEGIKVRITAKADDEAAARALLDAEEAAVRSCIDPRIVFGMDDQTMESVVLDLLAERGLSFAVAESLTGGLVAARVCSVPGVSAVFRGGVVAYDPAVKFSMLAVPEGPVVSAAAAEAMAVGVRAVCGATVGLATTGVAGPDELEGQPPGTVCLAAVVGDRAPVSQVLQLPGRRQQVREYSVISALALLRRELLEIDQFPKGA